MNKTFINNKLSKNKTTTESFTVYETYANSQSGKRKLIETTFLIKKLRNN